MVAVVVAGNGAVVAVKIAFRVGGQKTHAGGTGILQIRVQEKCRLAHAGCADHKAVDVVGIHQRRDLVLRTYTAEDDTLI